MTDSEEMVKQANIIINDCTKHIDSMKQKIWNMSKKLRMKNEELEVKSEDFEKAIDVIVDLRERLVELGEDLSDDEEEDWLCARKEECWNWTQLNCDWGMRGEGENN